MGMAKIPAGISVDKPAKTVTFNNAITPAEAGSPTAQSELDDEVFTDRSALNLDMVATSKTPTNERNEDGRTPDLQLQDPSDIPRGISVSAVSRHNLDVDFGALNVNEKEKAGLSKCSNAARNRMDLIYTN